MCGLTGYLSLTQGQNNIQFNGPDILARMNQQITHRGPDSDGFFYDADNQVGLAHRRLAIIDVSAGQQPMATNDERFTIVFNGEIYNYLDINAELIALGYSFDTHSDTETILKAYQCWGKQCLEKLNGMFSFALWDAHEKHLFIARDRIGEKPLYYCVIDEVLYFASELKSLKVIPGFSFLLCPQAVEEYMTFGYVPEPKTIYDSAYKLCSGYYMSVAMAEPLTPASQYWDLPWQAALVECSSSEQMIEKLKAATDIRMMAEVPLGAFLSGGVDSSAVVAMMSGLQDDPVNTVAIGFDQPDLNESEFAQLVATRYATKHTLEVVDHESFDIIDTLSHMYDEPFADSSSLPTFKVCQAARKNVTVCLSGDGGDELFVGYRRYRLHANESKLRDMIPAGLRTALFKPLAKFYPKLDWAPQFLRAKTTFQSLSMSHSQAYLNSMSKVRKNDRDDLYSDAFKAKLGSYTSSEVFEKLLNGKTFVDPIKEAQYLDFKTWMPGDILTKVDRASMANSLEVRVPMLDHNFVEWAFKLPTSECLQGKNGKANLKKALEPHLSNDTLYREKMGFSIPLAEWLKGPLQSKVTKALSRESFIDAQLFDHTKVMSLISSHADGTQNNADVLWSMLMLSNVLENDNKIRKSLVA